jgi:hypothetical protein
LTPSNTNSLLFIHRRDAKSAENLVSFDLPLRGRQIKNNLPAVNFKPLFNKSLQGNVIHFVWKPQIKLLPRSGWEFSFAGGRQLIYEIRSVIPLLAGRLSGK